MWPPGRWQTLKNLEKGIKLTLSPFVGAQVPELTLGKQREREDFGYLFQQHLAVRLEQAQTLLVSKGTFILTMAQWL